MHSREAANTMYQFHSFWLTPPGLELSPQTTEHKMINGVRNPSPSLGQAEKKCGGINLLCTENNIPLNKKVLYVKLCLQ